MGGELPRSGHSYFGTVASAQEAHAILEACKHGLLPRVTRRLTDDERLRFVRAGAVFVWEEEEAGIRRWTDHIKWSPSRVSGAFLTYTEVPSRGEDTLVKQSFSSVDGAGTKMHLIAYTSKSSAVTSVLPYAGQDPLIQHMLAQRNSHGRDPRDRPFPPAAIPAPPPSRPPDPLQRFATAPFGSAPPTGNPHRVHLQRSQPISHATDHRPRTASSSEESRPQTSVSEPRLGSAHGVTYRQPTGLSFSFPSLAHHSVCTTPQTIPVLGATPGYLGLAPPSASPSRWSFAYDALQQGASARSASKSRSSSSSHRDGSPQSSLSPPLLATSGRALSTTESSVTTASPFDPHPRHLPPLEVQPIGVEMGACATSLHPRSNGEEGQRRALSDGEQWCPPRQSGRGAEDERQLRLLGRSF